MDFDTLSEAVRTNDLETLRNVHKAGGDLNVQDVQTGYTLLHIATTFNQIEAAKFLLQQCSFLVLKTDNHCDNALFLACKTKRSLDLIETLLIYGSDCLDVNQKNIILHHILLSHNIMQIDSSDYYIDVMKLLLYHGANMFSMGQAQLYLFKAIVIHNNVNLVRILVHNGVDPFTSEDDKNNAFEISAILNKSVILNYLLTEFPQVITEQSWYKTFSEHLLSLCILHGSYECSDLLLRLGVDKSTHDDNDGNTLLIKAAIQNNVHYVKHFLAVGIDPNLKNFKGKTALYYAVFSPNIEIVKLLILAGSNPNVDKYNEESLIFHMIDTNNYNMLQLLIKGGIDIFDETQQNVIQYAFNLDDNIPSKYFIINLLLDKITNNEDFFPCANLITEHPLCMALRSSNNSRLISFLLQTNIHNTKIIVEEQLHFQNDFRDVKLNLLSFYLNSQFNGETPDMSIVTSLINAKYSFNSINGSIPALSVFLWNVPEDKMNLNNCEFLTVFFSLLRNRGINIHDRSLQSITGTRFTIPGNRISIENFVKYRLKLPDALWIALDHKKYIPTIYLLRYWKAPPIGLVLYWSQQKIVDMLPTSHIFLKLMSFGIPHGTLILSTVSLFLNSDRIHFESQHLKRRILGKFSALKANPSSLKQLSRFAVRSFYSNTFPNHLLPDVIRCLPVPATLKQYLCFE